MEPSLPEQQPGTNGVAPGSLPPDPASAAAIGSSVGPATLLPAGSAEAAQSLPPHHPVASSPGPPNAESLLVNVTAAAAAQASKGIQWTAGKVFWTLGVFVLAGLAGG